ncbi:phage tail tube protein [Gluconacetobacter sp. Hr-1-5]|uniref:phage tail tube protein n=1 Tax=Gluconacetobacter sp. Hr-1-5 TaxID=3395370 RepID=UPI003B515A48
MGFTGATAGLAAGAQTNDTVIDYALEATFGVPPTGDYQALRITGDSLRQSETTSRPDEINAVGEVSESVVTQVSASGSISGALSTTTFDDMFAGVMSADFAAAPKVLTVSAEVGATVLRASANHGGRDAIAGAADFANWPACGAVWIRDATNNLDLILPYLANDGALLFKAGSFGVADQTALSVGATITLADIVNGKIDKTYTFRKKILGKFLHYPGSLVNQGQIQLNQGGSGTVSFDLLSAKETISDADIAASVLPAPTGPVHNTVDNYLGCWINGVQPEGCVTASTITLSRSGSGADYGNGHADACGMRKGSFQAAASISYYFRSWDQYQDMRNGKKGPVVIRSVDDVGNGYAFAFLNSALRNGNLPTQGKNQTYTVSFDIDPGPMEGAEGTFAIFRISGAA